ncbi:hypothetical protein V6N13_133890 [Hibiscus sabdariffa]
MEDVVTSEATQELFEITTYKFQEMIVLTLFKWGNVRMSKARKHVKLIDDSIESAYGWEQKEFVLAAKRYEEALKIKSDFHEGLEEVNSIGAYISIPKNLECSRTHKLILAMRNGDERFVELIPKLLQNLVLKYVKGVVMIQFASDNMKIEQSYEIFVADLKTSVCNPWTPKDILVLEVLFLKAGKCYSSDENMNKNMVVLIHENGSYVGKLGGNFL